MVLVGIEKDSAGGGLQVGVAVARFSLQVVHAGLPAGVVVPINEVAVTLPAE
jgi:hypothetical protein